ncbi:hypothetical protein [Kitasatospora sp. NPDC048538]|uniref:hypothetical protein n=1 Tax=unclassified Kitasatospora TaxID=2633591 RepID=UPI0033EB7EAD
MHARLRRGLPALMAAGLTAGVPLLTAPPAHAGTDCGRGPVQYSVDGGAHWTADASMPAASGTVQVRLAGVPTAGCDYHVSLGSYATEGATWATSGAHTLLGWATTTLTRDHYRATLDIGDRLPPCYGELALHAGGEKYDGADGDHPLPHYPDEPYSGLLIASWNGGTACPPKPTGGPTTAAPAPTVTPAPTVPTATPVPTTAPTAGPTATPTSPATATATPTPTATTTRAAPSVTSPHPSQPPATPAAALASTGADDGSLAVTAVAAAALLAAGGAALHAARRRSARR